MKRKGNLEVVFFSFKMSCAKKITLSFFVARNLIRQNHLFDTCTHTYTHAHKHALLHTRTKNVHTHTYTQAHTQTLKYRHIHTHICTHILRLTQTLKYITLTHSYSHTHMHALQSCRALVPSDILSEKFQFFSNLQFAVLG